MTLALLATMGSGTLALLFALWLVTLSVRSSIRDGNRFVVNSLKHDSGELIRLRAEFEALQAAVNIETTTHRQLTEQTRRTTHLRAV